ncbi:MAG: PepSY domain-containing protein [Rhodospirillales bacterium]|nr:PepSY domain-containing protein [Rhodospirillales bacterium]
MKQPLMKQTVLTAVAMLAATGIAVAQTTPPAAPTVPETQPKAQPKTPPAGATTSTSANAAKAQIEASGYTGVKALKRQEDGSWQARAMKNNVEVAVSVDGRGNVTQMSR